jgi:sortase (surface protein transpeptidase)
MFIALWSARLGDIVEISGPSQILRYRVAEIHPRVATTDLTYLLPSTDERVTLQTSTGPLQTDPRFVVIALPEDR